MNKFKTIWVLTDNKIGSNNQIIALAKHLGADYKIIKLEYNFLSQIPNIIMRLGVFQLSSPNILELLKLEKPDLVLSASRKSAIVSAYIKKLIPDVFNCHILNPEISYDNFDLVVLPEHDNQFFRADNSIRIMGALCNLEMKDKPSPEFIKNYPEPEYISVLVGGNSKNYNFTQKSSSDFARKILEISESCDLKFMITFSRRTPEYLKDEFRKIQNGKFIIFDPDKDNYNPYPDILKISKIVISTCDSISMCSEVLSSGRPLYLYIPDDFDSIKHLKFINKILYVNLARKIEKDTNSLQEYHYTPLNESIKVADYILSSIIGVK